MKDLYNIKSPVRSKAFAKFIGEKVLVWENNTGNLHPGILIGKTKYTIRLKTTSGELRFIKDDIFLVDYACYDELIDLANKYIKCRSELDILINKNAIL